MAVTLSLAMAFGGCAVEGSQVPPPRTEGEFAVFSQINDVRVLFSDDMCLAAGLREWMSRTADAERETVRSRFFNWGKVFPDGEGSWILTGSNYWNAIRFTGDFEAGLKSVLLEKSDERIGMAYRFELQNRDDGFDLVVDYRLWEAYEGRIEWAVTFETADEEVIVTAAGEERCLYNDRDWYPEQPARWEVAVKTLQPLRWSAVARVALESRQTMRARYYVPGPGASPSYELKRDFQFEALQTAPRAVTIIRDDCTEKWKLWY